MEEGESRFTFKCLACGHVRFVMGKFFGTGLVSSVIESALADKCSECGGQMFFYGEEMQYEYDEVSERYYSDAYEAAKKRYNKKLSVRVRGMLRKLRQK